MVEVLIVVLCLSVIVPSILGAYSGMLKLNKTSNDRQEYITEVSTVRKLLAQDFEVKPLIIELVSGNDIKLLSGTTEVEYKFESNILYRREASDPYLPLARNLVNADFVLIDATDNTLTLHLKHRSIKDEFKITIRSPYNDWEYTASGI